VSTPPPRLEFAPGLSLRGVVPPLRLADFRLIAFDMDSTLIDIECIDEIADVAGRGPEVAAITEAAMRGEIADYRESLRRRLALLRGVPVTALERVYRHRLRLHPGAMELIGAVKAAGLKVLLVSGGFTFFTERLQARLGLDHARSNQLGIADGLLTGEVVGEIVDAQAKADTLRSTCEAIGCTPQQAIAMGDGANDLEMMRVAGLSVAYRAKPRVRAAAHVAIDTGGLDRLLELFEPR
jgi:phosphoserine phosphatase